jgi:hypothetical protein
MNRRLASGHFLQEATSCLTWSVVSSKRALDDEKDNYGPLFIGGGMVVSIMSAVVLIGLGS